jgi:hypothetical protein
MKKDSEIRDSFVLTEEDHVNRKVLFDSVSVHFSISVFINQFLVHILFPLLVPLEIFQNGWLSIYTHGFEPKLQVQIVTRILLLISLSCRIYKATYLALPQLYYLPAVTLNTI